MLVACPIELKEANQIVMSWHRHHMPVVRDKFRVACKDGEKICGVIQVGRPINRVMQDGKTLEVLRCCTDGTKNACSFLYSRAARIAKEMGYEKIITYILKSEDGASLKASGWTLEADNVGGGTWDTPSRRRETEIYQLSLFPGKEIKYSTEKKQRWVKNL